MIVKELVATLGLETISEGWEKAEEMFEKLEHKAGMAFAVIGAGIVALTGITVEVAEHAEKVKNLSESLGVNAEEFQKQAFAASLADVGMEEFGQSLKFLQRNLAEAGRGTKEQKEEFAKLGIAVHDSSGKIRPANEVLLQVANKFKGMTDKSERVRVAMSLFGRAGAQMIPVLARGADGIRALGDEAENAGIVMSDETLEAYEHFNVTLRELKAHTMGFIYVLAGKFLPALSSVVDRLLTWYRAHEKVINKLGGEVVQVFADVLELVANAIGTVVDGLESLNPQLKLAIGLFALIAGSLALPIVGTVALSLAIAALLSDLQTFYKGGQSVFGKLVDWAGNLMGVAHAADKLRQAIHDLFSGDLGAKVYDWMQADAAIVRNQVVLDAKKRELAGGQPSARMGALVGGGAESPAASAAISKGEGDQAQPSFLQRVGHAVHSTFAPQQTNNITINASTNDADKHADAVKKAIQEHWDAQMQGAYADHSDGVAIPAGQ